MSHLTMPNDNTFHLPSLAIHRVRNEIFVLHSFNSLRFFPYFVTKIKTMYVDKHQTTYLGDDIFNQFVKTRVQ